MASTDVTWWDEVTPVRFALYFSLLITSIWFSVKGATGNRALFTPISKALLLLSLIAACTTWYLIISFFVEDMANYDTPYDWIIQGDYFVGAYSNVIDTDPKYWFSSQLLTFVCAMTVMMVVSSWRFQTYWYFIIAVIGFGFFGAISAALPIFFVAMITRMKANQQQADPEVNIPGGLKTLMQLALCSFIGLKSVFVLREYTVIALALLHMILYLPAWFVVLYSPVKVQQGTLTKYLTAIYMVIGASSFAHHLMVTTRIMPLTDGSPLGLIRVLVTQGLPLANYCQLSISTDLLLTTIACFLYFMESGSCVEACLFIMACPLVSLGSAFCGVLICREFKMMSQITI